MSSLNEIISARGESNEIIAARRESVLQAYNSAKA
jgi:hypothetical protein